MKHGIGLGAIYEIECFGPDGILKWADKKHNLCVDEGLTYALDSALSGGTAITAWYVALFEDNHTPAAGNTYATPGYTECTAYTEATRQAWTEAGVTSKEITNSASKASFAMNATKTIYGAALVGGGTAATTKDDTAGSGKLFNLAQFTSGSKGVENGDTLKVTITIAIADA